jgi:dCMP deaminase
MREVSSWSKYFMNIAVAVSTRSKDPMTQVGAVLVNKDNHIIGTGYNGFGPGYVETAELWERPTKYDHVIHAEANAILNTTQSCSHSKLYVTLFPCKECAKLIVGAKIKKVYYLDDKYKSDITIDIFKRSGVELIQLK